MRININPNASPYKEQAQTLDVIQQCIEDDITYASIIDAEDLYHEEEDCLIRAFTFSKGMREQIVVVGPDTTIYANYCMTERPVSTRLIRDLVGILLDLIAGNHLIGDK